MDSADGPPPAKRLKGAASDAEENLQEAIRSNSMRARLLQQAKTDTALRSLLTSLDVKSIARIEGLPSKVLVTGSGGLLGGALADVLAHQGVEVVGLDVHGRATTVGSVTDADAVAAAMKGCQGVFHTAALHAPDAEHFSEESFQRVNVEGTENILRSAATLQIPVVHTSTTSLMMTNEVKAKIAEGATIWLDEKSPQATPRNKYGRSKLEAERRCLADDHTSPVVIVRTPRFFVEDGLEEPENLPQENLRALELFSGRRTALEDLVEAHLLALTKVKALDKRVFILTPPPPPEWRSLSLITGADVKAFVGPEGVRAFEAAGWQFPKIVDRVYDGSAAQQALDWSPRWTMKSLIDRLAKGEPRALRAAF